jgi:hypothetical protein
VTWEEQRRLLREGAERQAPALGGSF